MGVTMKSRNYCIDFSYSGFNMLRLTCAELTSPEVFEHYKNLFSGLQVPYRETFLNDYNARTEELKKKNNAKISDIFDFLHASDDDTEMDAKHCESIYEVIKDYDDDTFYGYAGRKDCTKFADFKNAVKDGIDSGPGFTLSF